MTNQGEGSDVNPQEQRLEKLISEVGLSVFPSDVQDEVEQILTTGQGLEPATRARFIEAAKRATHRVAISRSSLEVLLFKERRIHGQGAEDIAAIVNMDADTVRALERGERRIDEENPQSIAAWARSLDLGRETLDGALCKSLETPAEAGSYSGTRPFQLSTEQEDFRERVLEAFDESGHPDPSP